jgi:predicted enzyme related to lactoylglutathione lyase
MKTSRARKLKMPARSKAPAIVALDHIYIPTRDFDKAWSFWAKAAGGDVSATWGVSDHPAGQLELGGIKLVVAQEDENAADPELGYKVEHGRPVLFFSTPNIEALYHALANAGAPILRGPLTTHWGKRAMSVRAGEMILAFVEDKGRGKKGKRKR